MASLKRAHLIEAGGVFMLAGIVQTLTAGRDIALSRHLGIGPEMTTWLAAMSANLLLQAIAWGGLSGAIMAFWYSLPDNGLRMDTLSRVASITLLAVALVAVVAAPGVWLATRALTPTLAAPSQLHAQLVAMVVLLALPAIGASAMGRAVLSTQGKLKRAIVLSGATPLFLFGCSLLAPSTNSMALSFLLGSVFEGLVAWRIAKLTLLASAFKATWRDYRKHLVTLWSTTWQLSFITTTIVIVLLLAQTAAGHISAEALPLLAYGNKVGTFLISLGGQVVPALLLTRMAARAAGPSRFRFAMAMTGLVGAASVLLIIPLALFAPNIIALLFEGGQFAAADTATVAELTRYTLLAAPTYLAWVVLSLYLTVENKPRMLTRLFVLGLPLGALLGLGVSHWLGLRGVALMMPLGDLMLLLITISALTYIYLRRSPNAAHVA